MNQRLKRLLAALLLAALDPDSPEGQTVLAVSGG